MTFTSDLDWIAKIGKWKVKGGRYTNTGADTGGDIDTGLGNILCAFVQKTGNGTTTDLPVLNETFPDLAGPYMAVISKAAEDGLWFAIEGQTYDPTVEAADDETLIIDQTSEGNLDFVIGQIVDSANGTVATDLQSVLRKVEGIFYTPVDSAVEAAAPAVNEAFPLAASQTGGITTLVTATKTFNFLAWGKKGGSI